MDLDDIPKQVLHQSALIVVIADREGQVIYANPAFEAQTGYTRQEVLGTQPHILMGAGKEEGFGAAILQSLRDGQTWTGRITNLRKDGTRYETEATMWPVRGGGGEIEAFAYTSRDVTSDLRVEAQLRTSQKLEAIGQLASGIAHEINTPTQYIGDNIRFFEQTVQDLKGLLERYDQLVESARTVGALAADVEAIAGIKKRIDYDYLMTEVPLAIQQSLEGNLRVAEIVRAMKEFAHPGADAYEPVDVNHAIDNTLSVSRNEWKYIADVETDLADDLPPLLCDPSAFSQVVLNLFVNAAHAMEEVIDKHANTRGKLHVQTREDHGVIEIRIRDSGPGIKPEVRERIFEPFFTTKDVGKGTGQGLAMVHSVVVDTLGGSIQVESEPGMGATFILRIPAGLEVV